MDADEARLVDQCRGGSPEAWRRLLQAHHDALRATAYRVLLNAEEAEDAVQDAWVRIVRGLERFDGSSSFRTWATRVVINTALTRARMRMRDRPLPDGEPLPAAPRRDAVSFEDRLELRDALTVLSPEERAAVVLHFAEGYSFRELARMLGTPQRTAANLAYRGLSRLRERLSSGRSPQGCLT